MNDYKNILLRNFVKLWYWHQHTDKAVQADIRGAGLHQQAQKQYLQLSTRTDSRTLADCVQSNDSLQCQGLAHPEGEPPGGLPLFILEEVLQCAEQQAWAVELLVLLHVVDALPPHLQR